MLEARNPLLDDLDYHSEIKKHYLSQGIEYSKFMESHDFINLRLKEKLIKENIDFVDLTNLNNNEIMYDEGHHNVLGNEVISNILIDFFLNNFDID